MEKRRTATAVGVGVFLVAVAAAGFAFTYWRAKSSPTISIIRERDKAVNPVIVPGDRVSLGVKPAGYSHLLVLFVDENGEAGPFFPDTLGQSAKVSDWVQDRDAPKFEVTANSLTLHALFSNKPIPLSAVEPKLRAAVLEAKAKGKPLSSVEPPEAPGEEARYRLHVRVDSSGAAAPPSSTPAVDSAP